MDSIGLMISKNFRDKSDTYISIAPPFGSFQKGDFILIEFVNNDKIPCLMTVVQNYITVRKGSSDWDFIISLIREMPNTRVKSKLYEYTCTYMEEDNDKSDKN